MNFICDKHVNPTTICYLFQRNINRRCWISMYHSTVYSNGENFNQIRIVIMRNSRTSFNHCSNVFFLVPNGSQTWPQTSWKLTWISKNMRNRRIILLGKIKMHFIFSFSVFIWYFFFLLKHISNSDNNFISTQFN